MPVVTPPTKQIPLLIPSCFNPECTQIIFLAPPRLIIWTACMGFSWCEAPTLPKIIFKRYEYEYFSGVPSLKGMFYEYFRFLFCFFCCGIFGWGAGTRCFVDVTMYEITTKVFFMFCFLTRFEIVYSICDARGRTRNKNCTGGLFSQNLNEQR